MAKKTVEAAKHVRAGRRTKNIMSSYLDDIVINDFSNESVSILQKMVSERTELSPDSPVVVYINSYGGSVYNMFAMADILNSINATLITVAIGKAMSAGAALLSCGDLRFATENTAIMIHEASGGAYGNINDIKVDTAELERVNNQMLEFMAKNCNTKGGAKAFKKLFTGERRDIYLTPAEAKKIGLIDHIGFPKMVNETTFGIEG